MNDLPPDLGAAVDPSSLGADLSVCDMEPIHIPGSIQPHGMLLVADAATSIVTQGAGDIEGRLAADWLGRSLQDLLGFDIKTLPASPTVGSGSTLLDRRFRGLSGSYDVTVHRAGDRILCELEPAPETPVSANSVLMTLESASARLGRAPDLRSLCDQAAVLFRQLTGFDRVMIYRFLDDDAGVVVAEARAESLHSFLNHHFPASDIPKQARALYVRNHVRVIPDVDYRASVLRPEMSGPPLDMSDVAMRSVSPIHLKYLRNMGVGASASISIVKDGLLWGLVACHNETPKNLTWDVRAACRMLAGSLARQVRAKEEAETYRERLRLRLAEDIITARLARITPLDHALTDARGDIQRMLGADGFALVQGKQVDTFGACPPANEVLGLAHWLGAESRTEPFSTHQLSALLPRAAGIREVASGLLSVTLSSEQPIIFMWFRAERIEVINWAGNPHKAVVHTPGETLNPRSSFEAWSETVRGFARPWTLGEIEAAQRLKNAVAESRQNRKLQELNRELSATLADRERLLQQKDYLVKEVNHRVQNSLQLVSAFLSMQSRSIKDPVLTGHLDEAQRRLAAVSLVHKRLYRDDNVETVDLSRYLEDLCLDTRQSMGADWGDQLAFDLSPILIPSDRAVSVGLILTELVINANKYAYGGSSGPVAVTLEQYRNRFRLIVADQGGGINTPEKGFGTRMMQAMVDRLQGTIEYADNEPGLRVIVSAPIEEGAA